MDGGKGGGGAEGLNSICPSSEGGAVASGDVSLLHRLKKEKDGDLMRNGIMSPSLPPSLLLEGPCVLAAKV